MELDDLKSTWNEANTQVTKQQNMDNEMFEKMNDQKYRAKIKRITIPEIGGSIVCLAAAVFIGLNFGKLDTLLLQGTGALSIFLLMLLPIISGVSTRQLFASKNLNTPYAQALKIFAHQKIRFIKLQRVNVVLSYLLLVTIVVLLSKLFGEKDLSVNKVYWLFSFTLGYIFLLFYSKWVAKYYRQTLQQAEELLGELAG